MRLNRLRFEWSRTALLRLAVLCVAFCCASSRGTAQSVLTNAEQVRSLTEEQATRHIPVHLSGVLIEVAPHSMVLEDNTAGVYLENGGNLAAGRKPGDWIAVEGVSDPGEFAPVVMIHSLKKLGTRAIPPARRATFEQLAAGVLDAQWVEVSGVVRFVESVPANAPKCRVELVNGGQRLTVRLALPRPDTPTVDSRIAVRGVCFYLANRNRQALSPVVDVPDYASITVEEPAPADPFSIPVRRAGSLMQFSPSQRIGHRLHLRGIVTCQQPGEVVWIQDGKVGLRVETRESVQVVPGDEVDVLGFPARGPYSPFLEDAVVRVGSRKRAPVPVVLTNVNEAFGYDASLVQLEARITGCNPILDGWVLGLTSDSGTDFKAVLQLSSTDTLPASAEVGSRVRITGLCSVQREYSGPASGLYRPQTFQLLLRSANDIALVQAPPWWTSGRVAWLLGVVTAALLLGLAAVMALARWRLRKHALDRQMAETRFSAMLAERNRVAREIHDMLAQGLGAISLHLGLVEKQLNGAADAVRKHLLVAQNLARASLAEARTAIFNMRSQVLETRDLASALEDILRQMTDETPTSGRFEVIGRARRLSPVAENALLRIGQEAITNAERHARAKKIEVRLEFAEKFVRLSVADDGCGFDPSQPSSAQGNFGLLGMRERAGQLDAELVLTSRPGEGTKIVVTLPVSSESQTTVPLETDA